MRVLLVEDATGLGDAVREQIADRIIDVTRFSAEAAA